MGKQSFTEGSSRDSNRKPIRPERLFFVYETVAKIINRALNQEGTLRSLVYEHAKTLVKTHLLLAVEVARHKNLLEKLVSVTGLAEKEQLDPDVAQVLVYDLLFGANKQLPKGLDVFDRVTTYRESLQKALHKVEKSGDLQQLVIAKTEAIIPRYGRVNTLLSTLEAVVANLQRRGFSLIDLEGKTYQEFLECVRNLQDKEFVLDFHFPQDLLVFNPKQMLANLFVHKAGHLVVQDKTSYFPVACLGAPPGSIVLDACAAPGMKTIHLAAKMSNQGVIYALDINAKGMQNLDANLNTFGVQCCQSSFTNFLSVDPNEEPLSNTEYILLDVPCSHSGNRSSNMQVDQVYTPQKLKAIAALQFRMLSHALKFPKVKRIVYTTTSTEDLENEKLVQDVLSKNPDHFRLARAYPEWHIRGNPDYAFGEFCVRTRRNEDATIGCFVVVLERIKKGPERVPSFSRSSNDLIGSLSLDSITTAFIDKVGTKEENDNSTNGMFIQVNEDTLGHTKKDHKQVGEEDVLQSKKKRKGHKKLDESILQEQAKWDLDENIEEVVSDKKKKKKKKRRHSESDLLESEGENTKFKSHKSNSISNVEDNDVSFKTSKKEAKKSKNEDSRASKGEKREKPASQQAEVENVDENEDHVVQKVSKKSKKQILECEYKNSETSTSVKPKKKKVKTKEQCSTDGDSGGISIFSIPRKKK